MTCDAVLMVYVYIFVCVFVHVYVCVYDREREKETVYAMQKCSFNSSSNSEMAVIYMSLVMHTILSFAL